MVYEVPKEENVLKAFAYTNEEVPELIRLEDLRRICDANLKDWRIPIKYQYVWYCLSGLKIKRKRNKQILNHQVTCYPFYIQINKETSKFILSAIKKVGSRKKFANLVNRDVGRVCDWSNEKIRVPITALLKASQILNKDPWIILDGKVVCGQSESNGFVFKNLKRNKILDILTWIKLEGHIALNEGRIEIEQKDVGKDALSNINNRIKKEFQVKTHFYKRKRKMREGCMYTLRINSTALKQILYLKYGIDLGYKSPYVNLKDELNVAKTKLEKIKILTSAMETEGHFGVYKYQYYLYPRCNFTSLNKDTVMNVRDIMNSFKLFPYMYQKDKICWRIVLSGKRNCLKLFDLISPYMTHQKKIESIIKIKNTVHL